MGGATPRDGSNIWQDLLKRSMRRTRETNSSLIVFGDKGNGKSTLLNGFSNRQSHPNSKEYMLDYSFLHVKNKNNADRDETLAHMNIWQVDDVSHAQLVPSLLQKPSDIQNACFLITLDMSSPATLLPSLNKWLAVVAETSQTLRSALNAQQQQDLLDSISRHVQFYGSSSSSDSSSSSSDSSDSSSSSFSGEKSGANHGDSTGNNNNNNNNNDNDNDNDNSRRGLSGMSASLSSSLDGVELKEGVPAINTGIPIIVACCITDQLCRSLLAQHTVASLAEKKLDFIGRRLRQVCLEYGAALFYTSSMPRKRANSNTASASSSVSIGTNIEALQDYIFHRLYEADFHFSLPARVVGSTDDFGILVPSGYDTADLIDSTTPEHLTKAASPSSSSSSPLSSSSQPPSTSSSSQKLTDETPWNAVFPLPHKTSKEPSRSHAHGHGHGQGQGHSVARVKAQDDVTFFKTLKFQLDNLNNHRSSAAGAGAGAGPGVGAGGKTGAAGAGAMSSKGGPGKAGGSRRAVDLSRRKSSFHAMQGMQKGGATKASTAAQLNNLLKSRRRTIAHPNNASNSASLLSSLSSISASASSSSSASASASPSSSSSSTSGSVNPRRATEGGKMQGHQPKDKRQVAVKQFFRSLLVSGPKNEANRELRSNAQKALKGMKPKPREGGSSGV